MAAEKDTLRVQSPVRVRVRVGRQGVRVRVRVRVLYASLLSPTFTPISCSQPPLLPYTPKPHPQPTIVSVEMHDLASDGFGLTAQLEYEGYAFNAGLTVLNTRIAFDER